MFAAEQMAASRYVRKRMEGARKAL